MSVQVEDDFLVQKVQPPPAGLIGVENIVVPDPGPGDFPYDVTMADGTHQWYLEYVKVDTTLAFPAVNVWYVLLTVHDFNAEEEFVFGPEHPFRDNVPIMGLQHFGDLAGPYGDRGAGFYIKCYLLNRVPHNPDLNPWEDPNVATFQCEKKVIVAVDGKVPPSGTGEEEALAPNVTAELDSITGHITSHNTGAVFNGRINLPVSNPDYAPHFNHVDMEIIYPQDVIEQGKVQYQSIIIGRFYRQPLSVTEIDFTGLYDDRILLSKEAIPNCILRFQVYNNEDAPTPNAFELTCTLPAIGISSVIGSENPAERWQDNPDRNVHSVVRGTIEVIGSDQFYVTVWTNHPPGSVMSERVWHGWHRVDNVFLGAEGLNTSIYTPLVPENWSLTVEMGTIDAGVDPGPDAVTSPLFSVNPAPPPAGLIVVEDIIVPPPGEGDFPYDRQLADGSHDWYLEYVKVDTTVAFEATNTWTVQLTVHDFNKDEEFVFGPEHPYADHPPIDGIYNFGDLAGPYGEEGAGFYIKAYVLSRGKTTLSEPWLDPAVATFQCQKKVIVAVGGKSPLPSDALPPLDVTIDAVSVRYQNGKAYVSVSYTPPTDRFDRLHVYLYAPDTVVDIPASIGTPSNPKPPRWIIARNASEASSAGKLPSSVGGPADKGVFKHNPESPIVSFEHEAPKSLLETWRVVLCSGYSVVPEKLISESPFHRFSVKYQSNLGTKGAEYGPNFRNGTGEWGEDHTKLDAMMLPTWWFTLQWENPVEDPRWDRVVGWQLWVYDPTKTANVGERVTHGFSRIASLEKNATNFVLQDRWTLTRKPVKVLLYLVPQDIDGNINTFVHGINDFVKRIEDDYTFIVQTTSGLQLQYADGTTIDGIDFEVDEESGQFKIKNLDLTKVYGPSITSEFTVKDGLFQWGDNLDWSKFDPTSLGAPFDLNKTTGFLDFPFATEEFQTMIGGVKKFNIKQLKEDLFGSAEFRSVGGKIEIKGVDFTKALPGTFSPEFALGAGNIFQVDKLSADKIKTGILEVGGAVSGGQRVSRFKVFDVASPTPGLIGWIGDDRDASGYIGAWFKRVLIGGADPSQAQIFADANGNVTANCIFTGTLAANVVYAGKVAAENIEVGVLKAGVVLTEKIESTQIKAGTLAAGVVYAGNLSANQITTGSMSVGGSGMPGQIFVYTGSNNLIGWIGTYSGYEGAWFKRILLGGSGPADAKIACDYSGNLTITGGILTAPEILNSQLKTSNITGSTLVLNQNNITTSIQNQGGLAPVTSAFIGIRVTENFSPNWWTGMSAEGVGAFTPTQGFAILFSDALQVYNSSGQVVVRIGTASRGSSEVGIWFNGVKVL